MKSPGDVRCFTTHNFPRRIGTFLTAAILLFSRPASHAQAQTTPPSCPVSAPSDTEQLAKDYVTTFYPRWFTYVQSSGATLNQLVAPQAVTPLYQTVVAVNVDTFYASTFLDLSSQPAILTIPDAAVENGTISFSGLMLDQYGQVLNSQVLGPGKKFVAGTTYALTYAPPGTTYTTPAALPPGVVPLQLPYDHPVLIFRVDKYIPGFSPAIPSSSNPAEAFRDDLKLQSLAAYQADPAGGKTKPLPMLNYAAPIKVATDTAANLLPLVYLDQLTKAVASSTTQPFTPYEKALSDSMNEKFTFWNSAALAAGVRAAHHQITSNYLGHTGATGWVHFTNFGAWGCSQPDLLDRASTTEYLQYANNLAAASYFHTFVDASGKPLNGDRSGGYSLTFTKDQLPDAQRFWSLTAYTPNAIELVPNKLDKYNIASYTPGLTPNQDGSLTLYFGTTMPPGVPPANFLPVPPREFNLMLRVYGPEGNTADTSYVPPSVQTNR